MIRNLSERRIRAITLTAGALTFGLGAAGLTGALTVGSGATTHGVAAGATPSPVARTAGVYFVCLAYQPDWGLCIGPPTN